MKVSSLAADSDSGSCDDASPGSIIRGEVSKLVPDMRRPSTPCSMYPYAGSVEEGPEPLPTVRWARALDLFERCGRGVSIGGGN